MPHSGSLRMIDGVHIWRAALDEPAWPGPEELPSPERERAAAFLCEAAARRWVAARWALRRVLAGYVGEAPADLQLDLGEHGKPRLLGGDGPEFTLSHSGPIALVAVAERPIGVDVEAIRPRRDLLGLARRALPPGEAEGVRSAPQALQAAAFYKAWTRHEARLKCLGTGLAGLAAAGATAIVDLDVGPGFAAAIAVAESKIGPLHLRVLGNGG